MFIGYELRALILVIIILKVTSCGWAYPREGGISLVGEIVNYESENGYFVKGCHFDVVHSSGRTVYSKMDLYHDKGHIFIRLNTAPNKDKYTVKVYCSGNLVKTVVARSLDAKPTNMGVINAKQT